MSSYQPKGLKKIFHNTRRCLAKNWLSFFNPVQIAITGSQGKTSTASLIAKVLANYGNTVTTDLNLDTIYNVPITALKVRPCTKYLVWELGIDHVLEMDLHLEIVKPLIAIVTGISPVHTDKEHLGSLENLIQEKTKLVKALTKKGAAILNYDDKQVRQMAKKTQAKVLFYGTDKKCDVFASDIKVSLEKTTFLIHDGKNVIPLTTGLIGDHNAYTIMACYLVLKTLFPKNPQIINTYKKIISNIKPLKGRMSVEKGPLGTVVLNDSLRANPQSTFSGLKTLSAINYQTGRKIAIIGVMGELAYPIALHQETSRQLMLYKPDITICLGDFCKYTYEEALRLGYPQDRIYFAKDVFEAADILKKIIKKGDLIYLKGSLLRNLKRILQILNGQKVCCRADICPYDHCSI